MLRVLAVTLFALAASGPGARAVKSAPASVAVTLSEWKVELSQHTVVTGPVAFAITNKGSVPHAFEIEGREIEKETDVVQPGNTTSLTLTLKPGTYEVYCPVGNDAHKMLGMLAHLTVGAAGSSYHTDNDESDESHGAVLARVRPIEVESGGPVIQILPGPFPFPDSVASVLDMFGAERATLEAQIKNGPYSNDVVSGAGRFDLKAWDNGMTRDSVAGTAEFTTRDGVRWRLVMDGVQTRDAPHHPRFGGVILGLYYHGMTGVHSPLVPTIRSAVALWAYGHLYRNESLVTDSAMVHVMLVSRTRRDGDFALSCWDCSNNKVEELQLQILPAPGQRPFDSPGGFLFVNWEQSRYHTLPA